MGDRPSTPWLEAIDRSIRFLVALLKQGRFYAFAPYNWAIGLLTIAYGLWRG